MKGERAPLSNGLLFGLTAALFGGSFWALLISGIAGDEKAPPLWILIGGGFLFWFLVGYLIGAFNAPRADGTITRQSSVKYSLLHRMLAPVGWFVYRLLVGYFVGIISTIIFYLIGIAPWFAIFVFYIDPNKELQDRPEVRLIHKLLLAPMYCGFWGGIFGALLVSRRTAAERPKLSGRAVRGSFLAFLFGFPLGASLGWLPPEEEKVIWICLVLSVPIGILSGILGGLWTDVRKIRDSGKK